jgi:hypothetical protein
VCVPRGRGLFGGSCELKMGCQLGEVAGTCTFLRVGTVGSAGESVMRRGEAAEWWWPRTGEMRFVPVRPASSFSGCWSCWTVVASESRSMFNVWRAWQVPHSPPLTQSAITTTTPSTRQSPRSNRDHTLVY